MSRFVTLTSPGRLIQRLWQRFPIGSVERLVRYDVLERSNYAYGVFMAAKLARQLRLPKMSVIEFGVAGGRGLIALEQHAIQIGSELGVDIQVYGFDTGQGLPPPRDRHDHPYLWEKGLFRIEPEKLTRRLRNTKLILGDVNDTIPATLAKADMPPVGFVSFDLDYYSSTRDALRLFDGPPSTRLPRVFCYLDDVCEPDWAAYTEFAGELLAVRQFNETHQRMKLGKMQHLSLQRVFPEVWNEQMYVLHDFDHPTYSSSILPDTDRQLPI